MSASPLLNSYSHVEEFSCKIERARILSVYADRGEGDYSFSDLWNLRLSHQRQFQIARLLRESGMRTLTDKKILEVGCGDGRWLRLFNHWGATPENLFGCDINTDRIAKARQLNPAIQVEEVSGHGLPYEDEQFDIVLQSTVFTSILSIPMKQNLATHMLRVVKPEGCLLWFDFRYDNPKNKSVRGIGRAELRSLFPGCQVHMKSIGLLPPLARRVIPVSSLLATILEHIPPLRYAYLARIRKEGTGNGY
ncbi:MAG: class I SAM-dependent methyltransferase [Pirellulales bacterium]